MVRTQVLKHFPGATKRKSGGSKGDVRRGATARGAMEKGGCVRVIEGEVVRRDDPIEYFLSTESEVPFESQRGLWQLKSPRIKRFLEEGRIEREKESVLPSVWEERIGGGIHIKKRERRGVVKRNVDPCVIRVVVKRRKRGC